MPDDLNPAATPPESPPPAEATTPVAPAVESQQPPPPAVSPIIAKLAERGFENVTEAEAFDRLLSAYDQRSQVAEQVKAALAELKQTPQPQPQQTQASGQGWWSPPQVDEAMVARYRTADGWKDGTPAEIRQQAEALEAYRERFARDLVAKPKDALQPLVKELFQEFFKEQYGQIEAQRQEQQFFQKVDQEHGDWIWAKDPHTGRRTDRLTEEGAQFNNQMVEFENAGLPKAKAFETALKIRNAEKAAAAQRQTPAQAAATNDQKKQELLNRAAPGLNRAGSLPAPGATPPRNSNLRFGQKVLQQMQLNGAGAS